MRILITGAGGQLGHDLQAVLRDEEVDARDHRALDISDDAAVRAVVSETRPKWVINAAAFNDVDGAEIAEDAEISGAMLDDLRVFLSARSIQPGISEWLAERDWISSRLKQELLTLKFGVAKGDEMEMRRDAVVRAALKKLGLP